MAGLSIGKAWEETSAFLGRESRLVAPVALALIAIPAALQGWSDPASEGGAMGLIGLVLLFVSMAGQMAIAQLAIGWSGSIGEAIGKAFRRMWSVFGAGLIVYAPIILLFAILFVASLGAEGLANLETMTPAQLIELPGLAPGVLILVAIVLFLSARLAPMIAVAMAEQVGVMALIKRSWALTRGHFGRLLAVMLLLAIASLFLTTAIASVVGTAVALAAGPIEPFSLGALVTGLISALVSAVIAAVYSALIGRIYVQLAATA